eukprot:100736_1
MSFKEQKNQPQIFRISDLHTKELKVVKHLYGGTAWRQVIVNFVNSFGKEILSSAIDEFGDKVKDEVTASVGDVAKEMPLPNCIDDEMLDTFADKFGSGLIDFVDDVASGDGTLTQNFKSKLGDIKQKGMGMVAGAVGQLVKDLIPDDILTDDQVELLIKHVIQSIIEIIGAKIKNDGDGLTIVLQNEANRLKNEAENGELKDIMNKLKDKTENEMQKGIDFGAGRLIEIANKATGGKFEDYIEKVIKIVQTEMEKTVSALASGQSFSDVFKGMMDVGKELIINKITDEITKELKNQLESNEELIMDWIPTEIVSQDNKEKFVNVLIGELVNCAIKVFEAQFDKDNIKRIKAIKGKDKKDIIRKQALEKGKILGEVLKVQMENLKKKLVKEFSKQCEKYIEKYKQKLLEILNAVTGGKFTEYIEQALDVLQTGIMTVVTNVAHGNSITSALKEARDNALSDMKNIAKEFAEDQIKDWKEKAKEELKNNSDEFKKEFPEFPEINADTIDNIAESCINIINVFLDNGDVAKTFTDEMMRLTKLGAVNAREYLIKIIDDATHNQFTPYIEKMMMLMQNTMVNVIKNGFNGVDLKEALKAAGV